MRADESRKPTFIWQALLILLPIVVLAGMGWHSLRQDQLRAEQEASQRAAAIANELLPKIWAELTELSQLPSSRLQFRVARSGKMIFPEPWALLPAPAPLDLSELSAPARQTWLD